jgi:hypothetical protein
MYARGVNPAMFANAPRYHSGTFPGLKMNEVPAILEKDEGVFTAEQMKAMGGGGGSAPPAVMINFINNSGTEMDAEQGGMEFNGEAWVTDVIINGIHKQGKLRDALKGMK